MLESKKKYIIKNEWNDAKTECWIFIDHIVIWVTDNSNTLNEISLKNYEMFSLWNDENIFCYILSMMLLLLLLLYYSIYIAIYIQPSLLYCIREFLCSLLLQIFHLKMFKKYYAPYYYLGRFIVRLILKFVFLHFRRHCYCSIPFHAHEIDDLYSYIILNSSYLLNAWYNSLAKRNKRTRLPSKNIIAGFMFVYKEWRKDPPSNLWYQYSCFVLFNKICIFQLLNKFRSLLFNILCIPYLWRAISCSGVLVFKGFSECFYNILQAISFNIWW